MSDMYVNDVGRSEAAFIGQTIPGLFGGDAAGEFLLGTYRLEVPTGALCLPIVRGRARGLLPALILPPP